MVLCSLIREAIPAALQHAFDHVPAWPVTIADFGDEGGRCLTVPGIGQS